MHRYKADTVFMFAAFVLPASFLVALFFAVIVGLDATDSDDSASVFGISSFDVDQQAAEVLPEVLADRATVAVEQFDQTGMWPESMSASSVTEDGIILVDVERLVALTVAQTPAGFCVDGSFDTSPYTYYYSSFVSDILDRGVHAGSCTLGAAGSGGAPEADEDVEIVSASEPVTASSPVDWSPLVAVGATALGFVTLGGVTYGGVRAADRIRRNRQKELDARSVLQARWNTAKADLTALRTKSYVIEASIFSRLDFPVLFDYTDVHTARWVEAQGAVGVRDYDVAPLHDEAEIRAFEVAVQEARSAWQRAWAHAQQVKQSGIPYVERQRVVRARKLLERVFDRFASAPERMAFYRKAVDLLEGIVDVPSETRLELEAATRLELTSSVLEDSITGPTFADPDDTFLAPGRLSSLFRFIR